MKVKRTLKRKNKAGSKAQESQIPSALLDESPRPAKKSRTSREEPSRDEQEKQKQTKSTGTNVVRTAHIVSSLFTSNPEVHIKESAVEPSQLPKPSNAPLADKSTFAGLGLDPLIVSHLSTRMTIKAPTSIQREALPTLLSPSPDVMERDVFIQSQTGSGKTLSYRLPILQDLLPPSSLSYIDRSIGTLAIIIAPTRELAKQISDVVEQLLTLRLRAPDENTDEDMASSPRLTRWLVSGLLIGGENRTHEKARLRKGLPILVSTPGRLLDHLQNTSSFNVGKCRWLVLDEADRLMDLGFEESIKGILQALEGRRRLAIQAVEEGKSLEVGDWDWEKRRRTILCSATIKESVQHLAGQALVKPIMVKPLEKEEPSSITDLSVDKSNSELPAEKFTPPSQLLQKYVIVPLKLRLVTLVALMRTLLAQTQGRNGARIIVFLSCTDSVDYHWRLLGGSSVEEATYGADNDGESDLEGDEKTSEKPLTREKITLLCPFLPNTSIYRLHGSLPLQTRQASLKGFADSRSKSKDPGPKTAARSSSILLCTSVASRGLDLPLVRAVVQYDLPTEGGVTEYVHRVGRTARVGKGGEAWSFVAPSEQDWPKWVEQRMNNDESGDAGQKKAALVPVSVESVLKSGFSGKGVEYEERATQIQLAFERWVLKDKEVSSLLSFQYQIS